MTVIEEVVYRKMPLADVIGIWVVCGIALCVGLALLIRAWRNPKWAHAWPLDKVMVVIYFVIFASWCVWHCVFSINQYHQFRTEYIVDIGEDMGYHEFYDKWEVISQEGRWYRIKEK